MTESAKPQQPKEPETAQEAAILLKKCLPRMAQDGLNANFVTNEGTKIRLNVNPMEVSHLFGILDGIASGNVLCGDVRINYAITSIFNALGKAASEQQPEVEKGNDAAKAIVQQLHQAANWMNHGFYRAAKFGLTQDKVPLALIAERNIGFGSGAEVGKTGRFVSSLDR